MFTPDPWRIGKHGSVVVDHQVGPADDDTLRWYGGNVICETVTPSNAALITVAPEMFDLLEEASRKLDKHVYGDLIGRISRVMVRAITVKL